MRTQLIFGAVLLGWLLSGAALGQPVESSPLGAPRDAVVGGGGRRWAGFRIEPGRQISVRTRGGGTFRAFYFQEYQPGRPFRPT